MFITRARLRTDLKRWREAGWVTEAGAGEIAREIAKGDGGFGLYGALAVLGAVMLGLAAMSFVAAHWDTMSKLGRLLLLGSGIVASYGAAYALFERKLDAFAHAAVLTGIGLFGGSIMLIAQMYHMDGNPPDAVWLWACGALAAGLLLRSNPALGASVVLIAVWSVMTVQQDNRVVHWGFLPMWAIAATGVATTRWRNGMHLLAIALSGWLIMSCLQFDKDWGRYVLVAIGLALAVAAVAGGEIIDRWRQISPTMLSHGMVLAFVGLFMVQFMSRMWGSPPVKPNLWIWGSLTIALLVAAMVAGWRFENRRILWLAYAEFSIEIFSLYVATVGSMLGTSAFFFVMGVLVIALASVAYRMRNEVGTAQGAAS